MNQLRRKAIKYPLSVWKQALYEYFYVQSDKWLILWGLFGVIPSIALAYIFNPGVYYGCIFTLTMIIGAPVILDISQEMYEEAYNNAIVKQRARKNHK